MDSKSKAAGNIVIGKHFVDIFRGDELPPHRRSGMLITIEHQTGPTLPRQIGRVALGAVLNTELDEEAIGHADGGKDGRDDAVLAVLRANFLFRRVQVRKYMESCVSIRPVRGSEDRIPLSPVLGGEG